MRFGEGVQEIDSLQEINRQSQLVLSSQLDLHTMKQGLQSLQLFEWGRRIKADFCIYW
jgi:hypothetical protein